MERLIPVPVAAEILGISESTLYKWVSNGRISCVRVGDRVLFTSDDIQGVMVRREPRSLSETIARVLENSELLREAGC